ncbi:hypothetical protein, partial [Rhodanobacter sp. OR444]|uniref:hypothetical protein n=1 Tax=Rhodanobacter sp. OR444 TaxID=1076525 RepID=UPI001C83BE98
MTEPNPVRRGFHLIAVNIASAGVHILQRSVWKARTWAGWKAGAAGGAWGIGVPARLGGGGRARWGCQG